MDKFPYKIYRHSELVMQAAESCRYPKATELALLDAGYTIKLHGKRITKKEARDATGRALSQ